MNDFFDNENNNFNNEGENGEKTVISQNDGEIFSGSIPTPDLSEPTISTEPPTVPNEQDSAPKGDGFPPYGEQFFNPPPVQNKINYTDIKPINDYKPMSNGLKLFTLILAAVILLTGASATGYFLGKNSSKPSYYGNAKVDLSARPAKTDEMTAAQVYEKVNGSVVGITVYNTAGQGSQASGVIYSKDGYVVTNDHIYSDVGAPKFKVYTSDGKEYTANYVAGDQISDLAVLKIEGGTFSPAVFGDSNELYYGENVVAIGRPSDATHASSITRGIISSVARRVRTTSNYSAKLIQTDSAINPGSSGGALVNMYGQVIGITSSKLAGINYDAVGYAIPTRTMKRICEELISKGRVVSRAKLGITYQAINSVTAEINEYDHVGLYVASVSEDSDLYKKIAEGDIITHINDTEVTADDIVLDIIEDSKAGDKISVTVITSAGTEKTFEAVLKANTGESSYTDKITADKPDSSDKGSGGGTFDFPFGE